MADPNSFYFPYFAPPSPPPPPPSAKPPSYSTPLPPPPGAKPPSHSTPPLPPPGAKPPSHSTPPPPPQGAKPPSHSTPPPPHQPFRPPPPPRRQPFRPPPPPHVRPLPPQLPPLPPSPDNNPTVIVIVIISLGSVFLLAFLAVALLCCIKRRKKKTIQETDIIHIDKHRKMKEAIVEGPHGPQAVVLSVEDDVHVDEEIRKKETFDHKGFHGKGKRSDVETETEMVNFDEHKTVKEDIVEGPHGSKAAVLTIEDNVHIDEVIRKNESIGKDKQPSTTSS